MPTQPTKVHHPGLEERRARGKALRKEVDPGSHAEWRPAAGRHDPVELLEEQNLTREPDLVPVRHGRMMASPFTFYRGAAKIMAADLKETPRAGLEVQLCGDAHLSNFGVFASPERTLLFDLNDFDETLPGPFEYDVKRMTASFVIAARNNGFTAVQTRDAALAAVRSYVDAMGGFAARRVLDVWYERLAEDDLLATLHAAQQTQAARRARSRRSSSRRASPPPSARSRRHTRTTACRRSPSSPNVWTAGTASSAGRRSSCRPATSRASTGCPARSGDG